MPFAGLPLPGRPIEREEAVVAPIEATPPVADVPDSASTNRQVEALPRRRHDAAIGELYLLPSGLVVAPLQRTSEHSWDVRVLVGNATYPVGGYDLSVSRGELEVAREIKLELAEQAQ